MRIGPPVLRGNMGIRLRRRSVYLATIVAILAMTAGFAIAAFPNAFTLFGGTSSHQNEGTFTAGNTIWSGGASVALIQMASPGSCYTLSSSANAATIFIDGSATCVTGGAHQWYEDFTLTATEAAGDSDNFHWYVAGGANSNDQTFTVADGVGYDGAVTLDVYVEMGAFTANPGTVTSISATVAEAQSAQVARPLSNPFPTPPRRLLSEASPLGLTASSEPRGSGPV